VLPDEKATTAAGFLRRAVGFYRRYGIQVEAILSDNGAAYISIVHAHTCRRLKIRHLRIRPRRPQTNGKAERFIRTMLAGWAYGAIYGSSTDTPPPGWPSTPAARPRTYNAAGPGPTHWLPRSPASPRCHRPRAETALRRSRTRLGGHADGCPNRPRSAPTFPQQPPPPCTQAHPDGSHITQRAPPPTPVTHRQLHAGSGLARACRPPERDQRGLNTHEGVEDRGSNGPLHETPGGRQEPVIVPSTGDAESAPGRGFACGMVARGIVICGTAETDARSPNGRTSRHQARRLTQL
jgi:hypothetical protein